MANFNVNDHISDGNSLHWLALPEQDETPQDVEVKVRAAAIAKFGASVFFNNWSHTVASNGYIAVRMLN